MDDSYDVLDLCNPPPEMKDCFAAPNFIFLGHFIQKMMQQGGLLFLFFYLLRMKTMFRQCSVKMSDFQ